jgi:hypothetical protein
VIRHQKGERRISPNLYSESWETDKSLGEITREILNDDNFPDRFELPKDNYIQMYEQKNSSEIVFLSENEDYQISARGFDNSKNTEMTFLYTDRPDPEINALAEKYREKL